MYLNDLRNAVIFLRRVVAKGQEEDVLISTIEALEKEIALCQKKQKTLK